MWSSSSESENAAGNATSWIVSSIFASSGSELRTKPARARLENVFGMLVGGGRPLTVIALLAVLLLVLGVLAELL